MHRMFAGGWSRASRAQGRRQHADAPDAFYAPTGEVTRVGHRSALRANELVTRSFDVQADGTWKERRKYVWLRKGE